MAALVYYLLAYPLSLLPLRWLYLLSDAISFLFKNILPYRRKVIMDNLHLAFPEKPESEIKSLCNAYYDFLADVLIPLKTLASLLKTSISTFHLQMSQR
jgi:KDO2-lipid IV(A) lauroyltransferase